MVDLKETFEKFNKIHRSFPLGFENPPTKRGDLAAFIYLDKLLPDQKDMIAAAEHDEIWLGIDCNKLAEVATEDDISYLVRCGIRYDKEFNSLAVFV